MDFSKIKNDFLDLLLGHIKTENQLRPDE